MPARVRVLWQLLYDKRHNFVRVHRPVHPIRVTGNYCSFMYYSRYSTFLPIKSCMQSSGYKMIWGFVVQLFNPLICLNVEHVQIFEVTPTLPDLDWSWDCQLPISPYSPVDKPYQGKPGVPAKNLSKQQEVALPAEFHLIKSMFIVVLKYIHTEIPLTILNVPIYTRPTFPNFVPYTPEDYVTNLDLQPMD